jgi:hypothetical protein
MPVQAGMMVHPAQFRLAASALKPHPTNGEQKIKPGNNYNYLF